MERYNGLKDVYIQYHGEWASPELIYKRGCFVCRANYDDCIAGLNEPFIEIYLNDRRFVIGVIKRHGVWERF